MRRDRTVAWAALAVFFLPLLPLVAGNRLLAFRDAFITHFPIEQLAVSMERRAIVPFLNFGASNVEPLLPDPNSVVLYPTHLLFRVLPAAAAFNIHLLLHVAWAFFGGAILARRLGAGRRASWIGGATYAFSGPYLSYASAFTNAAAAAAWAPWALACAVCLSRCTADEASRHRSAMALGIALGLQLLAGEPAISAWTAVACTIPFIAAMFSSNRRRWPSSAGLALASGGIALAIAAPLILATSAAVPYSFRGEHLFSRDQFNAARNVPLRAIENLLPLVFGAPRPLVSGTFWGYRLFDSLQPYLYSMNFGLASLLLLFSAFSIARFRRNPSVAVIGAATLVFFLLSFGFATPLFEVLYAIRPLRHFRYPIKFALPAGLGISMLAALAARAWSERDRTRAPAVACMALAGLLLATALAMFAAPSAINAAVAPAFRGLRVGPDQVMPGIARFVYRDAFCGAAAMAIVALGLRRSSSAARAFAFLIAVLLALLPSGWPLFVSIPFSSYRDASPIASQIPPPGRTWVANLPEFAVAKFGATHSYPRDDIAEVILTGRRELWPLTGLPDGIEYAYDKDPDGSYGFVDRVFSEAIQIKSDDERARLLSAASVRFAITPSGAPLPGFHPRGAIDAAGRPIHVWEADRPVPIARAATRIFYRVSLSGAVDLVASPRFDPRTDVLLRGPDRDPPPPAGAASVDRFERIGNGLAAEISSDAGAVAVFAATYFKYWRATIDGNATPVEIADGSFCGVRVPPGAHRVALFYDERPFRRGAIACLVAAALLFMSAAIRTRLSRLSPGA